MAIPSEPTVVSIVTEAIKRGGRTTPNSEQITSATEHQFREVKADITQRSARHQSLETQSVTKTIVGQSRYSWPTDADEIRSLTIAVAPTDNYWRSTAQSGSASTIQLHTSFNQSESTVQGKFIFAFTSTAQVRQIISYNNSTKSAAVDQPWVTNPSVTTDYLIGLDHKKIYSFDKPWGYDTLTAPFLQGLPQRAAPVGREVWLDYVPDTTYALWWDYWSNLDRLDEAGSVFVRHLREHRSLWVQGIAVKTMQRYDEDRYQLELQVYQDMLAAYAGYSAGVGQVNFTDI